MASIKIIATPPGQAPESIRTAWVGLILPIDDSTPEEGGEQIGVLGGPPENLDGYPVKTEDAIRILRQASPTAANWWDRAIDAHFCPRLVFKQEVCELIP